MKIIVLRGKHSTDYYRADSKEAELASLRKIFECAHKQSYYAIYEEVNFQKEVDRLITRVNEYSKLQPHLIPQELQRLIPNPQVKIKSLARELHTLQEGKKMFDAILAGDDKLLKAFMRMRQDYEYENYTYEDVK